MDPEGILLRLPEGVEPWEALLFRVGLPLGKLRKALVELQNQGFPILWGEDGAGLEPGAPAPQVLQPKLKGHLGWPYRYFGTVTSTQDVLRAWPEAPEGAVVAAERQTHGRGRFRRSWESPPGNLYFSVLLRANADPLLPLRAGLALVEAAQEGGLKWPNDLLSPDGRKLGGILVEKDGSRVVLGVGINVKVAPVPGAAALWEFRRVPRADLLADFLWHLERWLSAEKERVLSAWRERNVTLGREVAAMAGNKILEGRAWDLGPNGELLLRTAKGMVILHAGEVSLRSWPDHVKEARGAEPQGPRSDKPGT